MTKRKILLPLCVLLVLAAIVAVVLHAPQTVTPKNPLLQPEQLPKQDRDARNTYKAFEAFYEQHKEDELFINGYGGYFIGEDNLLILKYVQGYEALRDAVHAAFPTAAICFVQTEVSYAELKALQQDCLSRHDAFPPEASLFNISRRYNKLVVSLPKLETVDMTPALEELLQNPHVMLRETIPVSAPAHITGDSVEAVLRRQYQENYRLRDGAHRYLHSVVDHDHKSLALDFSPIDERRIDNSLPYELRILGFGPSENDHWPGALELRFELVNHSADEIISEDDYFIVEQEIDGQWYHCYVFDYDMYIAQEDIAPGASRANSKCLAFKHYSEDQTTCYYTNFPPGTYRLVKQIGYSYITQTFTIDESVVR